MAGATALDGGASTSGLEDDFRKLSVVGERATRCGGRSAGRNPADDGPTGCGRPTGSGTKLEGMDDVLDSLREVIAWPVQYRDQAAALGVRWPKGVLVHGPSGVGKTAAVRAVCDECCADVHLVTPGSVIGQYMGESEKRLREVFERAEARSRETGAPGVILVEEADSLFPQRRGGSQQDARLVAQLLTLMDGSTSKASEDARLRQGKGEGEEKGDGGHVAVVAITTHPNAIDAALRRPGRFDREIFIPVPNARARLSILGRLAAGMNLAADVDIPGIAARCHGYTGADLQSLCTAALVASFEGDGRGDGHDDGHDDGRDDGRAGGDDTGTEVGSARKGDDTNGENGHCGDLVEHRENDGTRPVTMAHFEWAMPTVGASVARSVAAKFAPASWDDIGGLDSVKTLLTQYCVWPITRADDFKRLGIAFPKGVLLHGPPGCAKTTLARAAVTASGATFIPLLGTSLYSMYVGDGEAELRRAFQRARLSSPSVLFVDELDTLVGNRGDGSGDSSNDVSTRLLTTFLTELDGIDSSSGVLILGTTNRPLAIDAALLRPGRFDRRIYVPPPDHDGRVKALQVHTRKVPLHDDVDLERLAAMMDRYTGAELQAVCREATIGALRDGGLESVDRVTMRDFVNALTSIVPAHSDAELLEYERQYA